MSLVKNLLTQWETEEENRTRDQSMKNLPTDEGDWGGKPKDLIDIVDEKTFQPGLRTGKEKPRLMERGGVCSRLVRGGTWMIRDLVRIRCCVVLQESNCHGNYHAGSPAALPAPGRQISGYPPASGSRTTLTRIPLCRLFLIAFSLSPHLARVLARFVALCSVSCWLSLLSLCGELGCWLGHGQSGVQGC